MDKTTFVLAAMQDTQATIRAIDVKVAALLVVILAPLTQMGDLYLSVAKVLGGNPKWLFAIVVVAFFLLWVLSLFSFFMAISGRHNPAGHVTNSSGAKGTFYGGGLYELGFSDVFLNRGVIRSLQDSVTFSNAMPGNDDEVEKELVFEFMKLCYVRNLKLHRLNAGIRLLLASFSTGAFIIAYSKFGLS